MKVKTGQVWRKKGLAGRVVVCDFTLGGDVVVIPYRLRKSIRKFESYHQTTMAMDKFLEQYTLAKTAMLRMCDAAVLVLRETGNPAVMWGDSGLLHAIADQANAKCRCNAWHTEAAVLNALSKQPGELIEERTIIHTGGRNRWARIFYLPEQRPERFRA